MNPDWLLNGAIKERLVGFSFRMSQNHAQLYHMPGIVSEVLEDHFDELGATDECRADTAIARFYGDFDPLDSTRQEARDALRELLCNSYGARYIGDADELANTILALTIACGRADKATVKSQLWCFLEPRVVQLSS